MPARERRKPGDERRDVAASGASPRDSAALSRMHRDAADLVSEYQGTTAPGMRELAARYGVAYATMRTTLLKHGATLRPRGGEWRRNRRDQGADDGGE